MYCLYDICRVQILTEITISQDHKARLSQANKPKSAFTQNSPGTDKIGTANPWQEVNVNPRRGEIRCSGKGQHLLPHMWHPSQFNFEPRLDIIIKQTL